MKQGIVKKLSEAGRKAMVLFVKLNGLGIVGFSDHKNEKADKKIIAVNSLEQNVRKAS